MEALPANEAEVIIGADGTPLESREALAAERNRDSAAPFNAHGEPLFVFFEALMLVSLGASFLATAIYVVYDMRAQKKKLDGVDPSIVLTAADMHIDEPIASALTEGRIRLISCKWLMDEDGGGTLKNIASGTLLPEEAYLGGEESLALLRKGDRSILVLSYAWETLLAPDPEGRILKTVRTHLNTTHASDCGIYWDVLSLPSSTELPPPSSPSSSSPRATASGVLGADDDVDDLRTMCGGGDASKSSAGADTTSEGRRSSMAFVLDQPYAPSSNGRGGTTTRSTSSDYSSSSVSVSTNRTISSRLPPSLPASPPSPPSQEDEDPDAYLQPGYGRSRRGSNSARAPAAVPAKAPVAASAAKEEDEDPDAHLQPGYGRSRRGSTSARAPAAVPAKAPVASAAKEEEDEDPDAHLQPGYGRSRKGMAAPAPAKVTSAPTPVPSWR